MSKSKEKNMFKLASELDNKDGIQCEIELDIKTGIIAIAIYSDDTLTVNTYNTIEEAIYILKSNLECL